MFTIRYCDPATIGRRKAIDRVCCRSIRPSARDNKANLSRFRFNALSTTGYDVKFMIKIGSLFARAGLGYVFSKKKYTMFKAGAYL